MAKFKEPAKTVKAYKLFRVDQRQPGKLFPLFVHANQPVDLDTWHEAQIGEMTGNKVKSKIGPLAFRPGWHAGDLPVATHIGENSDPVNRPNMPPDTRPSNHVWAEVEMPDDVDWQSVANERGTNAKGRVVPVKAHITDQIPKGGHYRYKTNSNMTGNWLIGGAMKVNKVLSDKEVRAINKAAGVADLPRAVPFPAKKYGFAKGGSASMLVIPDHIKNEELANYRDPKTSKIADWKWRKMQDVRKDVPITEIPDYIQGGYGEFMKEQRGRAQAGKLSPRDLLKAFTITQSSIGRGGLSHATATKTGMKLPNTGGEVRPEGAFAEWLGSPMGQKYLNAAEQGLIDPAALSDIQQKFSPFGKHNQLIDQMAYAAHTIPGMAKGLNQAVTGSTDEYRDWAEKMKGIAGAKSGFVGSMLGRGDLPTLDARQLNLHTLPAKVGVGSIMARGKGTGAREAVDRLAARQQAMNLRIDPTMAPHYQHLAHHAVWDAMGNNQTTHDDLMKAMRGYADGGLAHMDRGGKMKPVTKGSTRKFDDNMRGNNIIKETGGNWLEGSVQNVLKPLRQRTATGSDPAEILAQMNEKWTPEAIEQVAQSQPNVRELIPRQIRELQQKVELNNWIDRNLSNYVKKQMGTAEDPVRKLAEQGVVHKTFEPEEDILATNAGIPTRKQKLEARRGQRGFPKEGMGQSEEAKAWEYASDKSINTPSVEDMMSSRQVLKANPWLSKLKPEETVHGLNNPSAQDTHQKLGFDHIVDILRQDVEAGRIRPEQLNKISMEQAVRRAYDFDQEQKRKMSETALKATEGMPVHKEYPEGYKWIELTQPKELPEGWSQMEGHQGIYVDPQGQNTIHNPNYLKLQDALKYEGDTMGHCVGGYCPDVASGKSRIFSLRDTKNEPHVTIEVKPHQITSNDVPKEIIEKWHNKINHPELNKYKNLTEYMQAEHPDVHAELNQPRPPVIKQIKGKGNAKPVKQYIPYVQDFVKSGNWSDVGDIKNAEMIKHKGQYLTHQEHDDWLANQLKPDAKAQGGTVHIAEGGDMDQMQMAVMNKRMATGGKAKKPDTPLHFPRAPALSKKAIEEHAERITRQMAGLENPNKKTKQQLEREKNLQVDIRSGGPKSNLPVIDYSKMGKNAFTVGVPGDPSIGGLVPHKDTDERHDMEYPKAGEYLQGIGGEQLSSEVPMYGGYMYGGYGHPAGWASDLGASSGMFNVVKKLHEEDPSREIYGHYHKMTPESLNHAVHFLDALMTYSKLHKLTDEQRDMMNRLMREVQTTTSKKHRPYPEFPGFENPADVMAQAHLSPDMRKKIISLIGKDKYLPGGTQRLDDVIFAASHPELRNIEIGAGGNSIIKFDPTGNLKGNLSRHPTYGVDIPSQAVGRTKYTTPFELLAPRSSNRAKKIIKKQGYTSDPFSQAKLTIIREPIDEQYINQMGEYENAMRKRLGYKKGGAIRMADGGQVDVQSIGVNEAPNMDVKAFFPPRPAQGGMLPVGGIQQAPMQPQPQPGMPGQPQQPGQPPMQPNQPMPGQQLQRPQQQPQQQPSNILQMTRQGQAMSAIKPPQMARGGHVDRDTMMLELMNRKAGRR